jgi:glucosamine--fructose-6-phosphate aminotransferase (isomerizing)
MAGTVAVVHNGILENHAALRSRCSGHAFTSETDTEVIACLLAAQCSAGLDLLQAVCTVAHVLEGSLAFVALDARQPRLMVGFRRGAPLVVGLGASGTFLISDPAALNGLATQCLMVEDNEAVCISRDSAPAIFVIEGALTTPITRHTVTLAPESMAHGRGPYRHYMLKEIYEQPRAIACTLGNSLAEVDKGRSIQPGQLPMELLARAQCVHIVGCGTSYHAGLLGRLWIEAFAGLPCQVELASEFRYRTRAVPRDCLLVAISQSGETADTLAALQATQQAPYLARMAICNRANSLLHRAADCCFLTAAGPEIGVASTKAFTAQLAGLAVLALALAQSHHIDDDILLPLARLLNDLPAQMEETLAVEDKMAAVAQAWKSKHHALFLGRGEDYPIALEGALKLKEISYIHAEGYAAGELKHGPLALVDQDMPLLAVGGDRLLAQKLASNLEEARARGGHLTVLIDRDTEIQTTAHMDVIRLPTPHHAWSAFLHVVPLQLLAYHTALLRGTDIDQPRNLAKSVTVE